jgi:hypothetical protein
LVLCFHQPVCRPPSIKVLPAITINSESAPYIKDKDRLLADLVLVSGSSLLVFFIAIIVPSLFGAALKIKYLGREQ